ncbi:nucleotidyltransferase family protein [Yoonia vestfoldensis]|jgi:MurNAc alpha-1-phosphate uridylyltransferase|uniref:D-glycero-alpha-D-manno-heptose 1-phosphate guanylyltransferase n=1 Tax=Yoonia vestfoldensis TaxID=245188 RepID=A0A1Y0EGW0_9RHOB|nr:nucleotidyltransferase family protein [Yoonia vestfoldensis]ARU02863.1 D-glycero-alpha-D-manno-heptose 1-phosphate guanylyltransferase [Yoonia vestfoldensis]
MSFAMLFFAAGLGTRMGDLVKDRPKPLVQVAGQPLIDHALALSDLPQIGTKVVNLHYRAEMLRAHLAGRNILFSDETDLLRETGGGLRHALPLLGGGPVITMNTDAVWRGPNPVAQLTAAWREGMEALLLIIPRDRVRGHKGPGDFTRAADGRLHRAPDAIYTGLQIIRTDSLADVAQDVFSLNLIWDKMAAGGGLYGTVYDGQWCDVGQPSSIRLAEEMLHV